MFMNPRFLRSTLCGTVLLVLMVYLFVLAFNVTQQQQTYVEEYDEHYLDERQSYGSPVNTSELHIYNTVNLTGVIWGLYDPGYVIPNTALCPSNGSALKVIILITSAPSHFLHRRAIRYTWGHFSKRADISIGFMLGSVENETLQRDIEKESFMYGDIVQAKSVDTYRKLTLKTVSLLQWVDLYCDQVPFVFKTDDDMFINVPALIQFIDGHADAKKVIFGHHAHKWKPNRDKKSKYYISKEQFEPAVFPDFTTGPAYMLTGDIIHDMQATALKKKFFVLEDVFFTGIIADELKIKRVNVPGFHPYTRDVKKNNCKIHSVISTHDVKYHEQFDLWMKLLDGKHECIK